MESSTYHSSETRRAAATHFPSLEHVTRSHVDTNAAAYYLNRQPQTLRGWACTESWPEGLRPVRINGRLGWPVAGIRAVLGLEL